MDACDRGLGVFGHASLQSSLGRKCVCTACILVGPDKKNYHNVPETKLEKRDIFKVLLINIFSVAYGTVNAKPVPRGGSRNRVLVDEP